MRLVFRTLIRCALLLALSAPTMLAQKKDKDVKPGGVELSGVAPSTNWRLRHMRSALMTERVGKGQRTRSVLVDLDRHRVIDILPGYRRLLNPVIQFHHAIFLIELSGTEQLRA
jgi:hypothetical protein